MKSRMLLIVMTSALIAGLSLGSAWAGSAAAPSSSDSPVLAANGHGHGNGSGNSNGHGNRHGHRHGHRHGPGDGSGNGPGDCTGRINS